MKFKNYKVVTEISDNNKTYDFYLDGIIMITVFIHCYVVGSRNVTVCSYQQDTPAADLFRLVKFFIGIDNIKDITIEHDRITDISNF